MEVRCVCEEVVAWVCFMLVLSVMSREAAGDEQKLPWPHLQYLYFFILYFPVMLSCFSQCNILVLIKANKDTHSVTGEERKTFWFPGEPDTASLLLLTINLVAASVLGWPCPVFTFLWLDYRGVQGELLCYCLRPWYLIACYSGALQSHVLPCNINLGLERNLLFTKAMHGDVFFPTINYYTQLKANPSLAIQLTS